MEARTTGPAELRVHIARYRSMLDFMDRLVATRELEGIARLFLTRVKYIADVVHCRLTGAWDDASEDWRDVTKVFTVFGTPGEAHVQELAFSELDSGERVVLAAQRVLSWGQVGRESDERLARIAAELGEPVIEVLPLRQRGGIRGALTVAARQPLTDLDRQFLRSLALLVGTTITSVIKERELVLALERYGAEMSALVDELSTVISPVWERVLAMPLVGRLDRGRTHTIMERLFAAVRSNRARHVILDLTGLTTLDLDTVGQITALLRGLDLMGVSGVVVGVQPTVAAILVEFGYDSRTISFRSNLREALAEYIREHHRAAG